MDKLDRLCRCRLAMGCVDEFIATDLDAVLLRHGGNLGSWADENWNDDTGLGRFGDTAQRGLIARMCDNGGRRRHLLCQRYQSLVFAVRRVDQRFERSDIAGIAVQDHGHTFLTKAAGADRFYPDALACVSSGVEGTIARVRIVGSSSLTPKMAARRSIRSSSSAESAPRALMTCRIRSNALRRVAASAGSIAGSVASAASVSISSR